MAAPNAPPRAETTPDAAAPPHAAAPHVVVIGAGFGGLEVARALGRAGVAVTVIDRRNHHLFHPLLYQVATAALSAPDIALPIRSILSRHPSVEVMLGEVVDIDPVAKRVRCAHGQIVGYDILVIAAGTRTSWFGHAKWELAAPGLKTVEDARAIRTRLLTTFEHAERTQDPTERERLMTVAVIGGGPTGVELAGAIAELARFTLARDFRRIRPQATRIMLVEGAPRLLGGFSEPLAAYAHRRLERRGVTVMTNSKVEDVSEDALVVAGRRIPVGLVIWAAGVEPSPLARTLGCELDGGGRIPVTPALEVPGLPGVYALGDIATLEGEDGRPLPGLAQVAKQQGAHLGRSLVNTIRDGAPPKPFAYRGRGVTAIVGRNVAIYEYGDRTLRGWFAWLLWAIVHVYLLVGFQNRLLVSTQWLWRYATHQRGARIISPIDEPEALSEEAARVSARDEAPEGAFARREVDEGAETRG